MGDPEWNIFFDLRGPNGTVRGVPNTTNPVECVNMASLLRKMMDSLPTKVLGQDLEVVGLVIKKCEVSDE